MKQSLKALLPYNVIAFWSAKIVQLFQLLTVLVSQCKLLIVLPAANLTVPKKKSVFDGCFRLATVMEMDI